MHAIVADKHQALADICRRAGVKRLEVFGSAARDDFDPSRSDIDFVVELATDPQRNPLNDYVELKDALEALFARPVDLVSAGSVRNPFVLASINRDRQLVFSE